MSEDFMLMEMPGAFERGQYGDYGVARPDVVRAGNAQDNGRQRSIPLGVVLTGYRLLTTIVIVGIGIPKAVYSYYGQSLVSPSLDWVGGIMFALLLGFISKVGLTNFVKLMVFRFFWLGVIEATRPELCPSFFQDDLAPAILGFLGRDDTPSFLDPATLGSLRRSNTPPLAPPTLGSSSLRRRGDTSSPLVPETLGVLSDDTSIPLIPGIPGVPNRDDTSPLDPATVGSLQRDNTLSLAPLDLGSLSRRDFASPFAPENLRFYSGHPSPPLVPEIPEVLGRDDTSPPLVPEISGGLRRGDTPTFSGIYNLPSSRNSSGPMSPTVRLAGTTPNHQNINQAMPGFKPLPSRYAYAMRGPAPSPRSWRHLDLNESEPEVDLTDLRVEEFQSRPEETSSHASPYSSVPSRAFQVAMPIGASSIGAARNATGTIDRRRLALSQDYYSVAPTSNSQPSYYTGSSSSRQPSYSMESTRIRRTLPPETARTSASRAPPSESGSGRSPMPGPEDSY